MARTGSKRSTTRSHVTRPLLGLVALVVVIYAIIGAGVQLGTGKHWTPQLGLDLEGGTQIVLTPVIEGGQKVTSQTLAQAVDIIRARIDGSGVGEAEVTTEGGQNVVVAVPGTMTQRQRDLIKQSSQLRFRAVLEEAAATPAAVPSTAPTGGSTPSGAATSGATPTTGASATANPSSTTSSSQRGLPQALVKGSTTTPTTSPTGSSTPTSGATPSGTPSNGSDPAWVTPELQQKFAQLDCTDTTALQGGTDDPNKPLVTCSDDGSVKYILGPVEVSGADIKDSTAGLQALPGGGTSTEWAINLTFDGTGTKAFRDVTTRLVSLPQPRNQFGIVLDGLVLSAPRAESVIADGRAEITGNFTQQSAQALANQLKYGALPISFHVQTEEQISPLLGAEQLQRGLLAGLIGLALVVIYSFVQYRALGMVTVASLGVAAILTYGAIVLLGQVQGFRLSLAGVTGVIVSIGITADSFIVYFERVRDEVRDGRTLRAAVETGWKRAKRTILAADSINFLAAVVLYILAAGGVRGFAYTLGLTTIIDVVVVFLFTHPTLTRLASTTFFGEGHRFSGLDPERLGAGIKPVLGVKANLGGGTIASRRAAAAAATSTSKES
ncbi:MAG TPA: protein translocase subunit SecD [Actinomycetales bacterium]|nr:protein translocase subunit SecD [Actinomycetales bacterium]